VDLDILLQLVERLLDLDLVVAVDDGVDVLGDVRR